MGEPAASTAAKDDAADSDDGGDGGIALTHFNFQHKVFATPGAKFSLQQSSRKPAFFILLGDLTGTVEIEALRREFKIEPDSDDGKLITLACQALRYVPDVRPGDSIPTELVNGTASWSVSDRHKLIAQQRLQVQLLSWVSGKELVLTDPKEIANFLAQIENKDKLKGAFHEAAVQMGLPRENTEPVMAQLELLARELCYIEALRDRVVKVRLIAKKLASIAKSYGSNERVAKQELERVQQLTTRGITQLDEILADADAQCGEVVAALKTVSRQVKFIRTRRDALHGLLLQWDESIKNFEDWPPVRTPRSDKAVNALYRFLAPRFTAAQSMMKRGR